MLRRQKPRLHKLLPYQTFHGYGVQVQKRATYPNRYVYRTIAFVYAATKLAAMERARAGVKHGFAKEERCRRSS